MGAGYRRIAVIAGVGVRNYYRKLGYELEGEGEFLIKSLPSKPSNNTTFLTETIFCLLILVAGLLIALRPFGL